MATLPPVDQETLKRLRRLNASAKYRARVWEICGQGVREYVSKQDTLTEALLVSAVRGLRCRAVCAAPGGNLVFPDEPLPDDIVEDMSRGGMSMWHSLLLGMRIPEVVFEKFEAPPLLNGIVAYKGITYRDEGLRVILAKMDGALHKLARRYYHTGQQHMQDRDGKVVEQSYMEAQGAMAAAGDAYLKKRTDILDVVGDQYNGSINGGIFSYLYKVTDRKMVEALRASTPEFAREWNRLRMKIARRGDSSPEIRERLEVIARRDDPDTRPLLEELRTTQDPAARKFILKSLIKVDLKVQFATAALETLANEPAEGQMVYGRPTERANKARRSAKVGNIADSHAMDADQVRLLGRLLTKRQAFVVERRARGDGYDIIAQAYSKRFRKPTSEGAIRKIRHDAKKALKKRFPHFMLEK